MKKEKKLNAAKSVGRNDRVSYEFTTYNHVKYFLLYLSRFWIRPLFIPNFWSSFQVLNLKLWDSLPWNLARTNNFKNLKLLSKFHAARPNHSRIISKKSDTLHSLILKMAE